MTHEAVYLSQEVVNQYLMIIIGAFLLSGGSLAFMMVRQCLRDRKNAKNLRS